MGLGQTFGFYLYSPDSGGTALVKLSSDDATAGGFTSGTATLGAWAYGAKSMRRVYGISSTKKRTSLPVATQAQVNSIYSAGTFTLQGITYTVEGYTGEKRHYRDIR